MSYPPLPPGQYPPPMMYHPQAPPPSGYFAPQVAYAGQPPDHLNHMLHLQQQQPYYPQGAGEPSQARPRSRSSDDRAPPQGTDEVSFSLLLPVQTVGAHFARHAGAISQETGAHISLTGADDATGTRKAVRVAGLWSQALQAQKRVLELTDKVTLELAVDVTLQTVALVPKDRVAELDRVLPEIEAQSRCSIKVRAPLLFATFAALTDWLTVRPPQIFPSTGGPDARLALMVFVARPDADSPKLHEAEAVGRVKAFLGTRRLPNELPEDAQEHCRVEIPVSTRFAGSVIGKGATIVRQLEHDTGAKINLSREVRAGHQGGHPE
jgi:hypothetical protein